MSTCTAVCESAAAANINRQPASWCVDADGHRCAIRNQSWWRVPDGTSTLKEPCECLSPQCPHGLSRQLRSRTSRSLSETAPRANGQECWGVIGVLSVTSMSGKLTRHFIRTSYATIPSHICIRFILGTPQDGTPPPDMLPAAAARWRRLRSEALVHARQEARDFGDVLFLSDAADNNCASKAFRWFEHAIHAFPTASWYGKADSDSFIHVGALELDLRALVKAEGSAADHVYVGNFMWAASWSLDEYSSNEDHGGGGIGYSSSARLRRKRSSQRGSTSRTGKPCGRIYALHEQVPRAVGDHTSRPRASRLASRGCNASYTDDAASSADDAGEDVFPYTPYPYAVGPLYLLSARLAKATFGESRAVHAFAARQQFECRAEDATIGYAINLAAKTATPSFDITLAHLTWAKLHNYAHAGVNDFRASPPGNESIVIHYLKPQIFPGHLRNKLGRVWLWLRHVTYAARKQESQRRCWPLIRFVWRPKQHTVRCLDATVWWLHWRMCGSAKSSFCRDVHGTAMWVKDGKGSPVWRSLPPDRPRMMGA